MKLDTTASRRDLILHTPERTRNKERARTLKRGSENGSIRHKDVQATKVGYGDSDRFLRLLDVTYVGWEGENLCGRSLTQDGISACVHETNAARCARNQDNLPRERLRVVADLRVDEWINADRNTVLVLLPQVKHDN